MGSKFSNKTVNKIRLNKFLSNAGIASRRKADEYILKGLVKVNNETVTKLGTQITKTDKVYFKNKLVKPIKTLYYILLNKPSGIVTTKKDEKDRKTIMDLISPEYRRIINPVGRLDMHSSGLILLTNDGEMANKLAHPSSKISKIYKVELDKPITTSSIKQLEQGVNLEDGISKFDQFHTIDDTNKIMGIELHTGKNRIIRRTFDALNYKVIKLDRVVYAGLTKKNLPRGKYRFLTSQEINQLKKL